MKSEIYVNDEEKEYKEFIKEFDGKELFKVSNNLNNNYLYYTNSDEAKKAYEEIKKDFSKDNYFSKNERIEMIASIEKVTIKEDEEWFEEITIYPNDCEYYTIQDYLLDKINDEIEEIKTLDYYDEDEKKDQIEYLNSEKEAIKELDINRDNKEFLKYL